jgi:hypothetical protein
MALDHILPTIPNNVSSLASFQDGAQSIVFIAFFVPRLIHFSDRDLNPPDSIDGDPINPRTRAHTAIVSEGLELLEAWDSYGIVADVVVSVHAAISFNIALSKFTITALHRILPARRYLRAHISGSFASDHQGSF